jgi:NitT/TauT family transport system permease protein
VDFHSLIRKDVATVVTAISQEAPVERRVTQEDIELAARKKERIIRWAARIAGYIIFLGLWEWASGAVLEENLLPGPTRIFETAVDLFERGKVFPAFGSSLWRIILGVFLSFMIGSVIGIITQNRWFAGFFRDAITIGLTSPGIIWVLITALVFGNVWFSPIIAIILTTFALVAVNVAEGIGSLPKDTIDMARAFKVSLIDRNKHIVIPHLAPYLFTGLRFSFSIGWKVAVLTEVFSAGSGIGFELRIAQILFRQDEVLTWILLFFVFALFLEKVILQAVEDKFFRWRKEIAST